MSEFGDAAREARKQRRQSLRSVADVLGFSVAYVSDIERGNRYPPAEDVVRRWANVLGQPVDDWVKLAQWGRPSVMLTHEKYEELQAVVDAAKAYVANLEAREVASQFRDWQTLELYEDETEALYTALQGGLAAIDAEASDE